MNQARLILRLRSWVLLFGLFLQTFGCQQNGSMQGAVIKPAGKEVEIVDKGDAEADAESERVSPPSNIIGSYLVCVEQEQLSSFQQNAVLHCGVYRSPAKNLVAVSNLSQWQMTGSTGVLRSLLPGNASQVELRFQAANDSALKQAIRKTRLTVKDDTGINYDGWMADLVPSDSRFSTTNIDKTAPFVLVWNEGFEGTKISTDTMLIHDSKVFLHSTTVNWVNPGSQNSACGLPVFEVMRFATQGGSTDSIGPAEGQQFIDTDSACWPERAMGPIRGPSNLAISKDLSLVPGRVYRVSFKVRQQPLPPGFTPLSQGLQLKINQTLVRDLRSFTNAWQEISFDWVAGSGNTKIEWIDVGSPDDSIGVLLDDLRVQSENF